MWASILDTLEARPDVPGIHLEAGLHGPAVELSPSVLLRLARLAADAFRAVGVESGDRIVTLLPTGAPLLQVILGAWYTGAAVCVMAPPTESSPSPLSLERLKTMLGIVTPKAIVASASDVGWLAWIAASLGAKLLSPADLPSEGMGRAPRVHDHDGMAFIQFTSGSTGLPKAVVIEHAQLMENCRLLAKQQGMSSTDTLVSWLPIHHDMGFVDGVMTPLSISARLVLLPTESYIRDPTRWLRLVAAYRASHSVGPPSAYQLLSRPIYARRLEGIDLSSLRCAVIGAEPVSWTVIQKFEEVYASHGLRPGVLAPGYGMAEATLVISGDALRPRRLAWIDRAAFQRDGSVIIVPEHAPGSLPLVSNGPLLEGFDLRVVDDKGSVLPDGKQGRMHIAGPCVTRRYFGSDENPQPDGWLDTGDLGFVLDGEIYVTGRIKDVIIRGGANVHAHDIEQAVLEGMPDRAQRAVAFALPRSEDLRDEIVIGVEVRSSPAPDGFAGDIRRIVARDVGVQVDRVIVLPKGAIPRTTSGKLQRGLARDLFRAGKLEPGREGGGLQ